MRPNEIRPARRAAALLAVAMVASACAGDGTSATSTAGPATTAAVATTGPAGASTVPSGSGTRDDPVPAGQTATIGDWEVTVLAADPDGTEAVVEENEFNEPPDEGRRFFLVRVAATYLGSDSEAPALGLTFSTVGGSSVAYGYGDACGVVPDAFPEFTDVFEGGTVSGNLCWSINGFDAGSLLLIAEPAFSLDDARVFMEIPPEGVAFEAPVREGGGGSAAEPGSRGNPIPAGEIGIVGDWEIGVLGADPDATAEILAHNQFNDPPAEGYRFFTVEVQATYRGADSEAPGLGLTFSAVGASSVAYDFGAACGVIPGALPEFGEVFTDGTVTGNLCWIVAEEDVGSLAMIVDDAFSLEPDRLFFEIPQ